MSACEAFAIMSIQCRHVLRDDNDMDMLTAVLDGIAFPSLSSSDMATIAARVGECSEYKEIFNNVNFYFPLVPSILQRIASRGNAGCDECALVVLYSYISWRLFVEYTGNFEHTDDVLKAVVCVLGSSYSGIGGRVYVEAVKFYLKYAPEWSFYPELILPSMELCLTRGERCFPAIQSILVPVLEKIQWMADEKYSDYIGFLVRATDRMPDALTADTAVNMVRYICTAVMNFEIAELHLFANAATLIGKAEVHMVCESLIGQLCDVLWTKDIVGPMVYTPTRIVLPVKEGDHARTFISSVEGEVPKIPSLAFERRYPNGYLYDEHLREKLIYFGKACNCTGESVDNALKVFTEYSSSDQTPKNEVLYPLCVIVSSMVLTSEQAERYCELLLSAPILDSSFSSFDCQDDGDHVNQVKAEALDALSRSSFVGIQIILEKTEASPVLFAEILHRVFSRIEEFADSVLMSDSFIDVVGRSFIRWQTMHTEIRDCSAMEKEIVRSTRACLISIINYVISRPRIVSVWFETCSFNDCLVACMFEDAMKQFALKAYEDFFVHQPMAKYMMVFKLADVIGNLTTNFHDRRYHSLVRDIIAMIHHAITKKPSILNIMDKICESCVNVLIDVPDRDETYPFVLTVLKLFSRVALTPDQNMIIGATIKRMDDRRWALVVEREVQHILSESDGDMADFWFVHQPHMYRILLQWCPPGDNLTRILAKFAERANISIYNSTHALRGGIADVVFDMIIDRDGADIQIYDLRDILKWLGSIHWNAASELTLTKYVSLMIIGAAKGIPSCQSTCIKALTDLITRIESSPCAYMPLCAQLTVRHVQSTLFERSFILAFSYFAEPVTTDDLMQFCSVRDNTGLVFNIAISSRAIVISSTEKEERVEVEFEYGKWATVALNFMMSPTSTSEAEVYVQIECRTYPRVMVEVGRRNEDMATIVVGSLTNSPFPIGYVSMVGVFPVGKMLIDNRYETGCISAEELDFMVSFQRVNGCIAPVARDGAKTEVQCSYEVHCEESLPSFVDILIESGRISEFFMPLSELRCEVLTGQSIVGTVSDVIDMYVAFCRCGTCAQEALLKAQSIEIMSHFLNSQGSDVLTVQLYTQLCSLLSVISHETLKELVLKHVIFDVDIWRRASLVDRREITQDWMTTLFPKYMDVIARIMRVLDFIMLLQDEGHDNIQAQNVGSVIVALAERVFSADDFLSLLWFCRVLDAKSLQHGLDSLRRVIRIPSCQIAVGHRYDILALLYEFTNVGDSSIFAEVVEIVVMFCRQQAESSLLTDCVCLFMMNIKPVHCSHSAFSGMLDLACGDRKELFPLCCVMAMNIGSEAIDVMAAALDTCTLMNADVDALFWFIVIFCNSRVSLQGKLCDILCQEDCSRFCEICSTIMSLSMIMEGEALPSILSLLITVFSERAKEVPAERIHDLLKMTYRSLLFCRSSSPSELISALYRNGPFPITYEQRQLPLNCLRSPKLLCQRILELSNPQEPVQFGLRMGCDGKWLDASLALQCMNLFTISFSGDLLKYDIVVTAFLARVQPSVAKVHLQMIDVMKYVNILPVGVIDFVALSSSELDIMPSNQINRLSAFRSLQALADEGHTHAFHTVVHCTTAWGEKSASIKRTLSRFTSSAILSQQIASVAYRRTEIAKKRHDFRAAWNRTQQQIVSHMACQRPKRRLFPGEKQTNIAFSTLDRLRRRSTCDRTASNALYMCVQSMSAIFAFFDEISQPRQDRSQSFRLSKTLSPIQLPSSLPRKSANIRAIRPIRTVCSFGNAIKCRAFQPKTLSFNMSVYDNGKNVQ